MVHLTVPGPDTGIFSTEEVRPRVKPAKSTSRVIALPRNHYKRPPNLAAGFKSLDLSHEAPVRANLVADQIGTSSFRITLETWANSILNSASATWIEHKANARDTVFGQFDTLDLPADMTNGATRKRGAQQENSKEIKFPKPFKEDCEVVCWLNRLDLASGDRNYRIRAYATNITREGFTAHLDTWGDSILHGAAMCFIAFPKRKRFVQAGSFSTGDVRSWSNPRPKNSARANFENDVFQGKTPTVLCALNILDLAGNADLRIKVDVDSVDQRGFKWHLDTWDDSTLYSAGASWVALGFT